MSVWTPLILLVIALAPQDTEKQPEKKIPSDSVEIVASGCLKGRVFTATGQRVGENVSRGPDVTGRSFRLAGPRDVMDVVKDHDGDYVEVVAWCASRRSRTTHPASASAIRVWPSASVRGPIPRTCRPATRRSPTTW
jgi:hypothetical protein